MNELLTVIEKALVNGLRPLANMPEGSDFLLDCRNFRCTEIGLEPIESPNFPLDEVEQNADSQFIAGDVTYYLDHSGDNPSIKPVNLSDWSLGTDILTAGCAPSALNEATPTHLNGTFMQSAQAGGCFFGTTGDSFLLKASPYSDFVIANKENLPVPASVCYHAGRMYFAGFDTSSTYLNSDFWLKLWNELQVFSPRMLLNNPSGVLGSSWVLIGMPFGGSSDKPFLADVVALTGYDSTKYEPVVLEAIRNRLIVAVDVPDAGDIVCIKPIGSRVVVYGTQAICLLNPMEDGSYASQKILSVGISRASAVSGDDKKHVFVTTYGEIWYMLDEFIPYRLGYKEFMYELAGGQLKVTFEPVKQDFFIHNGSAGFILSPKGLGRTKLLPSSFLPGVTTPTGSFVSSADDDYVFVTDMIDHRRAGLKLIHTVELEFTGDNELTVALDYRYRRGADFRTTREFPVNKESVAYLFVSALDYRLRVELALTEPGLIHKARVRWTSNDIRHQRGLTEQPDAV